MASTLARAGLHFVWISVGLSACALEPAPLSEGLLSRTLLRQSGVPPGARVALASESLLGLPYALDPLGEGPGHYDDDPLVRFDRFDCTTFVETVLAAARTDDDAALLEELIATRYHDGVIDFASRRHIPETDWIPGNLSRGAVVDITAYVAGPIGTVIHAETRRADFFAKVHPRAGVDVAAAGLPAVEPTSLPVVPLAALFAAAEGVQAAVKGRIPHGALVSLVRDAPHLRRRIGTDLLVYHQGVVVQVDGVPHLRHASSQAGRVIEEPLWPALARGARRVGTTAVHFLEVAP